MDRVFPNISWQNNFNTGVDEIDEQHQVLVNILNEGITKLNSDNSQVLLLEMTQELLAYALYHFETEEGLMQQCKYGQQHEQAMLQHIKEHRGFTQQVLGVREQLLIGQEVDVAELLEFLYQWLINHILKVDKALAAVILADDNKTD